MGKQRDEIVERARSLPRIRELDEGLPLIHKAQGARLFDVDNVGFIDYTGGDGSAIVGHANQYISDAVKKALTNGIPVGFHPPIEVDLTESLGQFIPWVRSWFFYRDEDEAFRSALAWAKRHTNRTKFLILGRGRTFDEETCKEDCRIIPGWQIEKVEAALTAGASKIAALIVDGVISGWGVVPAPEGLLARIAEICKKNGVLLIFDDRTVGFRVGRGGSAEWAGVTPDAAVFGGALGGGFPIGALGLGDSGRASGVFQGRIEKLPHPVSLRAAEAVLSILKNDAVFERIEERCLQLTTGMLALAERFSRPLQFNQAGSMFGMYASRGEVQDESQAQGADSDTYRRLTSALRNEGVLFPPKPGTPAFVSSAHGAKDIEETLGAFERVLLKLHQEDLP